MPSEPRSIARVGAACCLIVMLGCGGGGSASTKTSGSSSSGPAPSSSSSGASSSHTPAPVEVALPADACALFSVAEASAMLGFAVQPIPPSDGPYDRTCLYVSTDLDGKKPFIEFQVRALAGREASVVGARTIPGAKTVAGLGQDAVNSDFGLDVSINDEYEVIFTVGHLQQNDQAKSVELAKVVIDRLTK